MKCSGKKNRSERHSIAVMKTNRRFMKGEPTSVAVVVDVRLEVDVVWRGK